VSGKIQKQVFRQSRRIAQAAVGAGEVPDGPCTAAGCSEDRPGLPVIDRGLEKGTRLSVWPLRIVCNGRVDQIAGTFCARDSARRSEPTNAHDGVKSGKMVYIWKLFRDSWHFFSRSRQVRIVGFDAERE
jgi:hypothetical protein